MTEPEYRRAERVFSSATDVHCIIGPSEEQALAAMIAETGARHAVVGGQPYRGPLYAAIGRGRVVARFGVGHDGIDKPRATEEGVLCTNTPAVLDQSVAELTFLLIAAAARHLTTIAGEMREGRWTPKEGTELRGKTLAMIGAGRIGRAVARIATRGYDMRVVGYCRPGSAALANPGEEFATMTDDLQSALGQADFVGVLIPASPANAHFINAERLAWMQPHAWLINTARGMVVDEKALYDAVKGHRIAGAALDVYDIEPYKPVDSSRDLRTLSNVILTPHVGSHTPDANGRMATRALENILLAEAGEFGRMDLLNPEVLARDDARAR
ncbi:MAG TPA: NAD(P)-dependent oxidoreductase [Vicinamibacterales bacterium]|nr:NAD(P)-dependent oxidoreductase [Vicinamibacterales bacterium]